MVASVLGFRPTCQAVRGFPTFAPCLEHFCAGGGGVVLQMGVWWYISEGIVVAPLMLCYLWKVMGVRDV